MEKWQRKGINKRLVVQGKQSCTLKLQSWVQRRVSATDVPMLVVLLSYCSRNNKWIKPQVMQNEKWRPWSSYWFSMTGLSPVTTMNYITSEHVQNALQISPSNTKTWVFYMEIFFPTKEKKSRELHNSSHKTRFCEPFPPCPNRRWQKWNCCRKWGERGTKSHDSPVRLSSHKDGSHCHLVIGLD